MYVKVKSDNCQNSKNIITLTAVDYSRTWRSDSKYHLKYHLFLLAILTFQSCFSEFQEMLSKTYFFLGPSGHWYNSNTGLIYAGGTHCHPGLKEVNRGRGLGLRAQYKSSHEAGLEKWFMTVVQRAGKKVEDSRSRWGGRARQEGQNAVAFHSGQRQKGSEAWGRSSPTLPLSPGSYISHSLTLSSSLLSPLLFSH